MPLQNGYSHPLPSTTPGASATTAKRPSKVACPLLFATTGATPGGSADPPGAVPISAAMAQFPTAAAFTKTLARRTPARNQAFFPPTEPGEPAGSGPAENTSPGPHGLALDGPDNRKGGEDRDGRRLTLKRTSLYSATRR